MGLSQAVLDEIRYRIEQGFDNREVIFDWIINAMGGELGIAGEDNRIRALDAAESELLRDAIEKAFAHKASEIESWSSVTDCDRLSIAFEVLDKQGILALENPGLAHADSLSNAASIAVVRDELEDKAVHGYCFYTWNDMARAIEGEGLSLAYGTFRDEPAKPAEAPPERCTLCGGRGWIAASDPSQFPAMCSCRSAAPAAEPTPAPTLVQQVGTAVVQACRGAGLNTEWNGSPQAFIQLPGFRWQRRPIATQPSDVRDFLESWELELRAGYLPAGEMLEVLEERAGEWFERFSDFGPSLRDRLRSHTLQFLEEEQIREATWSEPSVNDRISDAFEELNQRGIFARECLGLTIQDGWGYTGLEATSGYRGAAFFHHEDIIDGVNGRGLLVAFGAIGAEAADDDAASLAVARAIVSTLESRAIPCSWSDSVRERIRIAPFEWRKRRWSKAPAQDRPASRPSTRSMPDEIHGSISAPQCGVLVRALRDERGYDLRRTMHLRASWKALGNGSAAQAGHLGLPHVFVPAGAFTTMMPQLAIANLREEKNECFLRGVRIRAAKSHTS